MFDFIRVHKANTIESLEQFAQEVRNLDCELVEARLDAKPNPKGTKSGKMGAVLDAFFSLVFSAKTSGGKKIIYRHELGTKLAPNTPCEIP